MEVYLKIKNKEYAIKLISNILIGMQALKSNDISIDDIGDYEILNENIENSIKLVDSFKLFKLCVDIGKVIEIKLLNGQNGIKNKKINVEEYYYENIKIALKENIDEVVDKVTNFIDLYGYFTTSDICYGYDDVDEYGNEINGYEHVFNLLDFVYFCYIVYEIIILFKSVKNYKPLKLSLLNSSYPLNVNKLNYKNDDEKTIIFDIIENKLNSLNVFDTKMEITIEKDYDKKNFFLERWKPIPLFSDPLSICLYELKLQLSEDVQPSYCICKNPYCNNFFIRENKNQDYCGEYECNCSRQNQRKDKQRRKQGT